MLIPIQFYGTRSQAEKLLNRAAKSFGAGKELEDLFGEQIDARDVHCGIVLTGPHSSLSRQEHFHMYSFLRSFLVPFDEKVMTSVWGRWRKLLEPPWGVLTVLGEHAAKGWQIEGFHQATVSALVKNAEELDQLGVRFYSTSPSRQQSIWDVGKSLVRLLGAEVAYNDVVDRDRFVKLAKPFV
ncbi:MAG: hypothetical protein CVT71_00990 [Alphaproteobacteria bacterium HGW-Alphaproteobacteria-10]|jgi:hypothetical protein|nr:MAG: hypothetical protein CVT71_00990 [Alphaproteobacteria bacterium HGW-Alphaproteobacteria-10]